MTTTPSTSVTAAHALAAALDARDFVAAKTCLHASCVYHIDDDTHAEPEAIIASYQQADDDAHAHLESVRYESSVRCEGEHAVIVYVDHLVCGEHSHVHQCEQCIEAGDRGQVTRITHRALQGERAAIDAFFARAGIVWPS